MQVEVRLKGHGDVSASKADVRVHHGCGVAVTHAASSPQMRNVYMLNFLTRRVSIKA